ncbi:NAD(P)-dependent glycerol-1-phosphate dehydrogenase [Natronorubrum bangense]|uniref:Glycerol-1-phosphate dehydrogenase [NAD(P)+] n=2 Tax=Natronorubrum bangense TaxID=61858 RepID=L9WSS9_9EURY|nr:NAD(P)-dependent glycerol-1-phosphate dehydrogenase [Natronorubrum bangense]ELY51393.1 NAD(P)-dependent glycerol-1-phosphate dehydrogenase [Natronorubrum bangense JCM 10635]QCC54635.1 NAD(P)-dependent glycerol-1-phosphate dehydrogenase [Natronorubrum bangense]
MFEKSAWIRLPRNVVVGHGVIDQVVDVIDDLHLHGRPLFVTSPTPRKVAAEPIVAAFEATSVDPAVVTIEKATFDAVERVIETANAEDVSYLVGIGGGKAIDIAKMASYHLEMGFCSVPTAASHDGIVSNRGSVPDGDTRHSVAAEPPLAVIADTEILADAPWELTTAGCADIISNYTAVMDWRLAHRLKNVEYSEYAAALAEMTAEILVDNADLIRPGLEESSWVVTKALMSSGVAMSIAGSSRPASGAEHLFSHQLDRLAPGAALHGHQVGVGSIMTAYLHGGERGIWQDIRNALASIDAPTTADGLGIDDKTVIESLTTCHEIRDRYTILGDGMDERAAREVATKTGVIS